MIRKRLHLIAAPVAAVALSLTVAGYQANAATASERSGTYDVEPTGSRSSVNEERSEDQGDRDAQDSGSHEPADDL
ncbi:hypothetical protein SAMN05428945_4259 [Streptomyces sp. 2224.1]|uniref:hypothetical protein n=1 Tax=Streptomyces sp. 2224.1 TaxID=1881020 RepID=UPI00089B0B1F|nr:hypothetical protein [Streptomyces sp. 2224.1]SED22983.1 hypothetical protein SAMN05428945_4259 [Streptomyces sp. 2224.1]